MCERGGCGGKHFIKKEGVKRKTEHRERGGERAFYSEGTRAPVAKATPSRSCGGDTEWDLNGGRALSDACCH